MIESRWLYVRCYKYSIAWHYIESSRDRHLSRCRVLLWVLYEEESKIRAGIGSHEFLIILLSTLYIVVSIARQSWTHRLSFAYLPMSLRDRAGPWWWRRQARIMLARFQRCVLAAIAAAGNGSCCTEMFESISRKTPLLRSYWERGFGRAHEGKRTNT